MTTALVTGVSGQDGVYLSRLLRSEGVRVVGTVLHESSPYLDGVIIEQHDVRDTDGFRRLLDTYAPDEVYNLAAISSVGASWDQPDLVAETNLHAVGRMLAVLPASTRFFQASSGEELTGQSPYARSKLAARELVHEWRERGRFAVAGILFNHESPLRPPTFVVRKITQAAAEISRGMRDRLVLGNTAVTRDWGFAGDYVQAMRLMLTRDTPDDFVIATGVGHTLRDVVDLAFGIAGVADPWSHVDIDPALMRPADTPILVGDPRDTHATLGWRASTRFPELIAHMVAVELGAPVFAE